MPETSAPGADPPGPGQLARLSTWAWHLTATDGGGSQQPAGRPDDAAHAASRLPNGTPATLPGSGHIALAIPGCTRRGGPAHRLLGRPAPVVAHRRARWAAPARQRAAPRHPDASAAAVNDRHRRPAARPAAHRAWTAGGTRQFGAALSGHADVLQGLPHPARCLGGSHGNRPTIHQICAAQLTSAGGPLRAPNARVGARSAIGGSTTLCDQSFDAVSVATSRLVAKDRRSAISS